MAKRSLRLLACGVAALALAGVGTAIATPVAFAKDKGKASVVRSAKGKHRKSSPAVQRGSCARAVFKAAAAYLGLSREQLRQQLPGHSLAQLAQANGKTVEGLKTALVNAFNACIAQRQGLSADRATKLESRFAAKVDAVVNRVFVKRAGKHRGLQADRHLVLKAAADYLGITVKQLRQELPGHSLAQLAVSHGKTVAGLEAALVSAVSAKVNADKTAGKITEQKASSLVAKFQNRVDAIVNHVFPSH
jgi:hypothetical protein